MIARIANAVLSAVSVVAAFATVLVAYRPLAQNASPYPKYAIIVLAVLTTGFAVAFYDLRLRHVRKRNYAAETARIAQVFWELLKITDKPDQAIESSCKLVVNRMAEAFSKITGVKCSACIKVVFRDSKAVAEEGRKPFVATLCRDDSSSPREQHTGTLHYVHLNTDFAQLFGYDGRPRTYFFCNDLRRIRGYKNTSFDAHGGPPKRCELWGRKIPLLNYMFARFTWNLPYRSTIVVPVSPEPGTNNRIVGYLCIDSASTRKFSRNEDVELMSGIALCLYPAVNRHRRMLRHRSRR